MSSTKPSRSRREFITQAAALGGSAALGLPPLAMPQAVAGAATTPWGWPEPYQKVSPESVAWLKSKGWWPLKIAWNPLWSDGNVVVFAMKHFELMARRGLEVQYPQILAAGLMNEVFIPGKLQIAQAGSLGLLRLIDLRIPTAALCTYPAQRQAFLVHPDSPLKGGMSALKGAKVLGRPAVCGVTIGSTNHLGLIICAKVLGLVEGRDYVISNMGPGEIITMPKGVDVTGIWEPNVLYMTDYLKNARILELIDRYEIFNGYSYARGEIAEHAPDVLQAYTDAFVEAQMLCRARTDEVLDALVKDPSQKGRSPELIRQDAQINLLDPKPTINYPFRDLHGFWARLEAYQANVMHDAGVLQHSYTPDEYLRVIQGRFMARTYAKVGWKVPTWPPFLPDGWTGRVGHPPYPPYGLMYMGKQSFPGPGDLVAGAHA